MSKLFTILLFIALAISGCGKQGAHSAEEFSSGRPSSLISLDYGTGASISSDESDFTLQTDIVDGHMVFVGHGGTIDDIVNPDLVVKAGTTVRVRVINGDVMSHDLSVPALGAKTQLISGKGAAARLGLTTSEEQEGVYAYFCAVSGHRQAGMEGKLIVRSEANNITTASN